MSVFPYFMSAGLREQKKIEDYYLRDASGVEHHAEHHAAPDYIEGTRGKKFLQRQLAGLRLVMMNQVRPMTLKQSQESENCKRRIAVIREAL